MIDYTIFAIFTLVLSAILTIGIIYGAIKLDIIPIGKKKKLDKKED